MAKEQEPLLSEILLDVRQKEEARLLFNQRRTELEVPADYLVKAKVYGYVRSGRMVGFYSIKSGPDLRYLGFVAPSARRNFPRAADCVEISTFWMDRDLPGYLRLYIYVRMQINACRTGADWVIVGSSNQRLRERNQFIYNHEFYSGENPVSPSGAYQYVDGHPRRGLLHRLFWSGVPRMALLQVLGISTGRQSLHRATRRFRTVMRIEPRTARPDYAAVKEEEA